MATLPRAIRLVTASCCFGSFLIGDPAWAEKDLRVATLAPPTVITREGEFPEGACALSSGTVVCNVGTSDIPWEAPMETDHPGLLFALYRLADGRFEQIGVSDVRHFYFAVSGSVCSPCSGGSDGTYLAPGCSDASGVAANADLFVYGPRSEWNPHLGEWECQGSHFSEGEPDCVRRHDSSDDDPLDHRLVVRDMDLVVPEARFFIETYFVVREEVSRFDNVGFREVAATWTGSRWIFSSVDVLQSGPALESMNGTSDWNSFSSDGELLFQTQVSENSDGTWTYEYSLYNLASHLGVRRVEVPVGDAEISGIGFHRADPDPKLQWPGSVSDGFAVWESVIHDAEGEERETSALLFGELFNYRFDANSPPLLGEVSVQAWRGTETLEFSAPVPAAEASSVNVDENTNPNSPSSKLQLSVAPNPSLGGDISFTLNLADAEEVTLEVFDTSGKRVSTLCQRPLSAGSHRFLWAPRAEGGLRAGVYFARVEVTSGITQTVSVTILTAP